MRTPALLIFYSIVTSQGLADQINSPGCGVTKPLGRIYNGKKIGRIDMPWMLHIKAMFMTILSPSSSKLDTVSCGGSILSPRFILTAAQCVGTGIHRAVDISVYYNTTHPGKGAFAPVEDFKAHPDYGKRPNGYDIALIKLKEPLDFDQSVRPICLPTQQVHLTNRNAFVAGWGLTNDFTITPWLHYFKTKVVPFDYCRKWYTALLREDAAGSAELVCTQAKRKSACEGDAGGPLTIWEGNGQRYVQVGVASFGAKTGGCSNQESPNVFTRVSHFVPWIRKMVQEEW
ncbi:chymotrypsin-like elastase family member 2A [Dermacentor andersoni]|uniref:chymotrypsin-like elastase family member 2A n=1 Tax=Dermacentor andersoni TaxID=34620 RepID=UPI003B3BDE19